MPECCFRFSLLPRQSQEQMIARQSAPHPPCQRRLVSEAPSLEQERLGQDWGV
jgi:hypothetical protein